MALTEQCVVLLILFRLQTACTDELLFCKMLVWHRLCCLAPGGTAVDLSVAGSKIKTLHALASSQFQLC